MSERMIPADKVNEILSNRNLGADEKITEIKAILHTPKRPTMEDMNREEREACRWMQADTARGRALILGPEWVAEHAELLDQQGEVFYEDHANIAPRPDLPRFEWPAAEKEADPAPSLPAGWRLADHPYRGRIVVTNPIPDSDGRVYYVMPDADYYMGYEWFWCDPAELTYLDTDQGADQ